MWKDEDAFLAEAFALFRLSLIRSQRVLPSVQYPPGMLLFDLTSDRYRLNKTYRIIIQKGSTSKRGRYWISIRPAFVTRHFRPHWLNTMYFRKISSEYTSHISVRVHVSSIVVRCPHLLIRFIAYIQASEESSTKYCP